MHCSKCLGRIVEVARIPHGDGDKIAYAVFSVLVDKGVFIKQDNLLDLVNSIVASTLGYTISRKQLTNVLSNKMYRERYKFEVQFGTRKTSVWTTGHSEIKEEFDKKLEEIRHLRRV